MGVWEGANRVIVHPDDTPCPAPPLVRPFLPRESIPVCPTHLTHRSGTGKCLLFPQIKMSTKGDCSESIQDTGAVMTAQLKTHDTGLAGPRRQAAGAVGRVCRSQGTTLRGTNGNVTFPATRFLLKQLPYALITPRAAF